MEGLNITTLIIIIGISVGLTVIIKDKLKEKNISWFDGREFMIPIIIFVILRTLYLLSQI